MKWKDNGLLGSEFSIAFDECKWCRKSPFIEVNMTFQIPNIYCENLKDEEVNNPSMNRHSAAEGEGFTSLVGWS